MVENASLCLVCTSKVNIACDLRIDYEDKYNSKCLQKILSYSNCLLCDSNSTSLSKTQDMPSSMLQQIELFMNSTSFPESYSNSGLCLTCILFLNIWHEVRSSVMKLKQNDENYGASDSTDKSKNTKTTKECTLDKSADFSRSENLSLTLSKQFRIEQTTEELLRNKHVIDKESLISDSSNSEIDSLSKIVDEIVHSYESEEDTLQTNSLNLNSIQASNFDDELSITTIDHSFEHENESNTSQNLLPKNLNFSTSFTSDSEKSSKYYSATSSNFLISNSNWITTREKFLNTMEDSSGSGIINEKTSPKLKPKLKLRRSSTCSKVSAQTESRKHKIYNNEDQGKATTIINNSSEEGGIQKNTRKLKLRRLSTLPNGSLELKVVKNTKSDKKQITKLVSFSSEDDEIITERNKQIPNPKTSQILKIQEKHKFIEQEQATESDTGCIQKEQSTFSESETTLIDSSSDSESNREESLSISRKSETQQDNTTVKDFQLQTIEVDVSSDNERITRTSTSFLQKKNKTTSETKPLTNEKSVDQIMQANDSSDCESVPDKETSDLTASFDTDTNIYDKIHSKISEEFIMKSNIKKSSHRKISTDHQMVVSNSSDEEIANTISSKLRKGKDTKIRKNRDSFWFYLNKKLDKLQSVKKLHKIEKINLPKNGLDEKLYKQVPYVLLNNNEVPKTMMNLPKINSITIALLDDKSPDIVNTSLGSFKTWCCAICDKTSKTLCEHKAHELFHIKPEQVVINVLRENLKQLKERYDRHVAENINKILAKYLNISELQEAHSSGQVTGCEEATNRKACIALIKERSLSIKRDSNACQDTPNVVNEKKRRLSIFVNKKNSTDKSDNCLRTPKKVRFTLDNNECIESNLQ